MMLQHTMCARHLLLVSKHYLSRCNSPASASSIGASHQLAGTPNPQSPIVPNATCSLCGLLLILLEGPLISPIFRSITSPRPTPSPLGSNGPPSQDRPTLAKPLSTIRPLIELHLGWSRSEAMVKIPHRRGLHGGYLGSCLNGYCIQIQ